MYAAWCQYRLLSFEFTPTGTKEHLGDISEFLDKYKYEHFRELEQTSKTEKKSSEKKASNPSSESNEKLSYEDKKAKEKEDRQLRSDLNKTEKKIEKLELELAEMENKMSDPTFYDGENEASKKLFFEHAEIQKKLDLNMQEWETLSEKIES